MGERYKLLRLFEDSSIPQFVVQPVWFFDVFLTFELVHPSSFYCF